MKTIQINRPVLQNLYGDCSESMKTVFSEFLKSHSEIRETLISTFNSGKIELLRKLLHFHGPTFMYLGMPVITANFKILEQQCDHISDKSSISSGFSTLLQMVDISKALVLTELENLREDLAA